MPLYAHARIEDPENPALHWERGDEVSDADVERLGLDPEYGAVSDVEYDEAADAPPAPDYIFIDGVRYERTGVSDAA